VSDRSADPELAERDPLLIPPSQGSESGVAEDTDLIRQVKAGSRAAFDRLVRRHLKRAYAVAYRIAQHREDAEDLVQEGFMAALDHIDRFETGRPFAPWLNRIIVNRALSARRSRQARSTDVLKGDHTTTGPSPLTMALRGEVQERFREALASLPERHREVIELHDVDGFSAEEIGGQLGVTAGTVRWYVHQARRVLRTALQPWRGSLEDDDDGE
jgi:RNA polymerase sigma-70 factor (ECF subfamily)